MSHVTFKKLIRMFSNHNVLPHYNRLQCISFLQFTAGAVSGDAGVILGELSSWLEEETLTLPPWWSGESLSSPTNSPQSSSHWKYCSPWKDPFVDPYPWNCLSYKQRGFTNTTKLESQTQCSKMCVFVDQIFHGIKFNLLLCYIWVLYYLLGIHNGCSPKH